MTPQCRACETLLYRVDHVATEHMTYDAVADEYRPLHALEGLASETELQCGHCGQPLTVEQRQFFYQRWTAIPKEMRAP